MKRSFIIFIGCMVLSDLSFAEDVHGIEFQCQRAIDDLVNLSHKTKEASELVESSGTMAKYLGWVPISGSWLESQAENMAQQGVEYDELLVARKKEVARVCMLAGEYRAQDRMK